MNTVYFDSSALLSVVLKAARAAELSLLWEKAESKVSSILLEAECWIGLRRHWMREGVTPDAGWMSERSDFLSGVLTELDVKQIDGNIISMIRKEPVLAECRTLDAIHLATALLFKSKSDEGFRLVSLDQKMRQIAMKLNLDVLPV